MIALLSAVALGIGTPGCGGPPPCARSSECRGALVCGPGGACEPLTTPHAARVARSRWLTPTDWGVAGGVRRLDDTLPVGGGSEPLLRFDGLPAEAHLLRALLVLSPHDRQPRVEAPLEVVIEHVRPFRGGPLPGRGGVTPTSFAAARGAVPAGPARPVRLDVSAAARDAARRQDRALYLLIWTEGGGDLRFASPHHAEARARPRLELLVH